MKSSEVKLCNKCKCLVAEYYISYKYEDKDYCPHCMKELMNDEDLDSLVSVGKIIETSYNEEFKKFKEFLKNI